MHFIASAITDPAKLVELPLVIFKTSTTFGIAIAQQSIAFVSDLLKVMVTG